MPTGQSQQGRVFSEEHRRKISESMRGRTKSQEHRHKLSEGQKKIRGAMRSNWKGDEVNSHAIHVWLLRNFPKTGTCDLCGGTPERKKRSATQFAFKHHPKPHTRNRDDFYEVCIPCHRALDRSSYVRNYAGVGVNCGLTDQTGIGATGEPERAVASRDRAP